MCLHHARIFVTIVIEDKRCKPETLNGVSVINPIQDLVFNVGGVEFRMKYIEGGTFMMGAPDSDHDAADDEKPAHLVTLDSYITNIDQFGITVPAQVSHSVVQTVPVVKLHTPYTAQITRETPTYMGLALDDYSLVRMM